jgi:predicted DNA-binding protein (UPF0278 family)
MEEKRYLYRAKIENEVVAIYRAEILKETPKTYKIKEESGCRFLWTIRKEGMMNGWHLIEAEAVDALRENAEYNLQDARKKVLRNEIAIRAIEQWKERQ